MTHQVIVYDPDGKVQYVIDPQGRYGLPPQGSADLERFANAPPGHGVLLYKKLDRDVVLQKYGHEFHAWQAVVDAHLKKKP